MSYCELLQWFPPRPITSEEQYCQTQQVIDTLIDKADLTPDEEEYLDLLGTVLYMYEELHVHIPDIWGIELIKAFLSERNLRQKELVPIFKTESIVSAVLNRHRKLTVKHIEKLAEFFRVSPSLFFKNNELAPSQEATRAMALALSPV
jgi:HTH-type transcriptional regulator/antitoxin HigA